MSTLSGNLLVAQSGGPTSVINSSLAGVVNEALRHECINNVYGGLNGIYGILREELVDLRKEHPDDIWGLKHTPAAALGTCRYKIDFKKPGAAEKDMNRLFDVLKAHDIRYFFYAGGNDSQDTSHKIHLEAEKRGWEMRVIGVPKTIDNDLPHTDHCPGYGSVVKYVCATTIEVGLDVGSMATDDGSCCIIEVMGRSAGWIAAGSVLAKTGNPDRPPHIVLLPEIPLDEEKFLERVRDTVKRLHYCIVVVGEGLKNQQGEEIGADTTQLDNFGHPLLSGAAEELRKIVQHKLNLKTRTIKLGYAQRAAAHFASAVDVDEANACGAAAVSAAVNGMSGYMVKLVRQQNHPYTWTTDLHPLEEVANVEHFLPLEWIEDDGMMPNEHFVEYVAPLIGGDINVPLENGLPKYVILQKHRVPKKLPPL